MVVPTGSIENKLAIREPGASPEERSNAQCRGTPGQHSLVPFMRPVCQWSLSSGLLNEENHPHDRERSHKVGKICGDGSSRENIIGSRDITMPKIGLRRIRMLPRRLLE